jgi:hypothetical protein
LCNIRKTTTRFNKKQNYTKNIFLSLDNSNLIGELLYFSAFWQQYKQLFSDVSTDVLRKKANYLCYDTYI